MAEAELLEAQELQELRPRHESEVAAGDLGATVATAKKIIRFIFT